MGQELLTSEELAKALHVGRRTITDWVQRGLITPAVTLPGGRRRWILEDVLAQLREHEERGQE